MPSCTSNRLDVRCRSIWIAAIAALSRLLLDLRGRVDSSAVSSHAASVVRDIRDSDV